MSDLANGVVGTLGRLIYGNPLYRLTLGGKIPDALVATPPEPWAGDPDVAKGVLDGEFPLSGRWVSLGEDPWADRLLSESDRANVGSFSWLADLRALGSNAARDRARSLVAGWINHHNGWDPIGWRSDILAARVTAWLTGSEFLLTGADKTFQQTFLAALTAQARHLGRISGSVARDGTVFTVIKGLIYAGLCIPGSDGLVDSGRKLLDEEVAHQILPDGGHFQRNPSRHLAVLRHLCDLRTALLSAKVEVPAALLGAIDRMAPMLRALRHGDGGLAVFNGGQEEDRQVIDAALSQAGVRGQAPQSAPHTGYLRLSAGRAVVLADVGAPPPREADQDAHAGALSFEMSVGRQRLIVNCGPYAGDETAWQAALRATAAHSTLCMGNTNSTEIGADGRMGPRAAQVVAARGETDHALWLEASHDGYIAPFGVRHHRRLMLDRSGGGLTGEDRITGTVSGKAQGYTIRFHLHPQIHASAQAGGGGILLKLPGGGGWRFTAQGGQVALEESLYVGQGDQRRRTDQIVVTGGVAGPETVVRWMLVEIPKG